MRKLRFRRDSPYQTIEVFDDRIDGHRIRHLYLDSVEHSAIDLDGENSAVHIYTDFVYLAWIFKRSPQNVLIAGLGGGTMPMRLRRSHPKLKIDVVEIDSDILFTAKTYFRMHVDPRMNLWVCDVYRHLKTSDQIFDVIILDVYKSKDQALWMPAKLTSLNFFRKVEKHLNPDGVVVFNWVGRLKGKAKKTLNIIKKLETLFPQVYLFPIFLKKAPNMEEMRNILIVCSRDKKRLTKKTILKRAKAAVARNPAMPNLVETAENLYSLDSPLESTRLGKLE